MQTLSLIESAMDRVAREAPARASAIASTETRVEPECDQTQSDQHERGRAAPGRSYRPGTLLLTAVFSAVGTAGLMWLVSSGDIHGDPAAAPPPAAVAPAAITPAASAPEAKPLAVVADVAAVDAAAPPDIGDAQARALLERWRLAWANRDVEAYLACYSPDFVPADGQTRSAWAAARRKKLSSQSQIDVRVDAVRVERIGGDRLKLAFLQDYASGNYRESARPKTLLLTRSEGGWKIAGEWQGSSAAAPVGDRQVGRIDRVVFRQSQ